MSDVKPDAKQIFLEALDRESPEELLRYLDKACGDNAELRSRVEELLRAHREVGNFLGGPPPTNPTLDQPITEKPGTVIGPYKLLQEIGHGGMGVVYMTEQTEPVERRVALKIIKPGMDTQQVIARFEAEEQALAMMDHPNIAKVLDAGTTESGRPYFVMELVKGIPITKYCDEQQLTPKQRLDLFIPVCQAVQHAHQKGIIHRDLKPSNVLIALYDDKPVPKVIDFGVAKATSRKLTEKTMFTQYGQIVGTLEYMSPEQANLNQLDIDTRSDIYSLGVLLYELLTGCTPFDKERLRSAALEEMMRIIREEEPPKPSTRLSTMNTLSSVAAHRQMEPKWLSALVRGDLDWIVMKALEKDRSRRYETADGFARDVERYLNDEPVVACPPSPAYRFRKFARRNKGLLGTIAIISAILLLATVVSIWQAMRATRAAIAERQAHADTDEARDLAEQREGEAQVQKQRAEEQLVRSRRTRYVLQIRLAQEAIRNGDFILGRDQLLQAAPDLRGWGHRYLWTTLRKRELLCLAGHTQDVTSVTFTPDGTRIVSSSRDGTVKVWDASNGEEALTLRGQTTEFLSIALSSDGKRIALGGADGTVRVRDASTGEQIVAWAVQSDDAAAKSVNTVDGFPGGIGLSSVGFSPDGKRIVSGREDGVVTLTDASTGGEVFTVDEHPGRVTFVSFSSDGKQIVSGSSEGTIRVCDASTGEKISTLAGLSPIHSVALDPNGTRIVTGPLYGGIARVWDAVTGEKVLSLRGASHGATPVAFSPDGTRIVLGSTEGTVTIWDASTGEVILALRGHSDGVSSVAFSPCNTRIVSGGRDGTVKVWNGSTGGESLTLGAWSTEGLSTEQRSGDNRSRDERPAEEQEIGQGSRGERSREEQSTEAPSTEKPLKIMGPILGTELYGAIPGIDLTPLVFPPSAGIVPARGLLRSRVLPVLSIALNADGTRMASAGIDGTVTVWNTFTGEKTLTLTGHPKAVFALAFNPDGTCIASGGFDKTVSLWDTLTGRKVLTLTGHAEAVTCIAFTSDGKSLVSGDEDGSVRVWDAFTGEERSSVTTQSPPVEVLSADGTRIATVSEDGTVRIWDAFSGDEIWSVASDAEGLESVALSSDGTQIALGGKDGSVTVWNTLTSEEVLSLPADVAGVTRVGFSPEGTEIVSGSGGTLRIWDLLTGLKLLSLEGHTTIVVCAAFSPDGAKLASADSDGTIKIWDASRNVGDLLLGHTRSVSDVSFSPDGTSVVSASRDGTVRVWGTSTGEQSLTLRGHRKESERVSLRAARDRNAARAGPTLVATGTSRIVPHGEWVTSSTFSPDGTWVVSGGADGTLRMWEVSTGAQLHTLTGHTTPVTAVSISPDGKCIVSAGSDGMLKVWNADAAVENLTIEGHSERVWDLTFSPNGERIISAHQNPDSIKAWDASTGRELRFFSEQSNQLISTPISIAISPDGNRLAWSELRGPVRIWDRSDGEEIRTLPAQSLGHVSVAFNSEGTRIASGGEDNAVRIWNASTGALLLTLVGHTGDVNSVAFSPDGRRVVSGSDDRTVMVWDVSED